MSSLLYLLKLNSHFVDCLKPAQSGFREWQRRSIVPEARKIKHCIKNVFIAIEYSLYQMCTGKITVSQYNIFTL